jgi:hypothetical protein
MMYERLASSKVRWLVSLFGIALLCLLAAYGQPRYPSPWLDEGFALQGAINLVRFGQYAMRSTEGFRILDQPLIANGPGIVLPMAAAFALFGIGYLQARLVAAALLVLTGVAFFAVARRLYGTPAALLSSFLLLAIPLEGFLWFGRMALGTVPALGYFLVGYLFWLTALKRDTWLHAIGAGLMFGLAMVTKGQYGLLLPMLLIVTLADRLYYRTVGLKKVALVLMVATACLGLWYGVQLLLVGWDSIGQHLSAIRSSSQVTVSAFRPIRIPRNLWYLICSGFLLFVVPGWIYAAWNCRPRNPGSVRQLLPVVFVPVWLAWYVLASTGWPRYAFDAYAIGLLFSGKFAVDAFLFLRRRPAPSWIPSPSQPALRLVIILLLIGMLVGGTWGFGRQIAGLLAPPDRSLEVFADYLREHIGPESVVESWDWQIDVLANLDFHHPPNVVVDRMTAIDRYQEDLPIGYDPFEHQPDYLIDGPWSKAWDLYTPYLSQGCCTLQFSLPPYDLYRVDWGTEGNKSVSE